jgi:hypothetical protein
MFRITGRPGNQKVFRQIADIPRSVRRGIKRGGLLAGRSARDEIRRRIEAPKHGRIYHLTAYWAPYKTIRHQASAPGEAPARFSGSLKASVNYLARTDQLVIGAGHTGGAVGLVSDAGHGGQLDLNGQIGFGRPVDYARKLETTMNRPYLGVSIQKKQGVMRNYYADRIWKELIRI